VDSSAGNSHHQGIASSKLAKLDSFSRIAKTLSSKRKKDLFRFFCFVAGQKVEQPTLDFVPHGLKGTELVFQAARSLRRIRQMPSQAHSASWQDRTGGVSLSA